jgi:hypothetical protein
MKYNIVMDSNGNFKGLLSDKLDVQLFKEQRDMDFFQIHKMEEKDFHKTFGKFDDLDMYYGSVVEDYVIFPDEEIFMLEGLDQMHNDARAVMGKYLQEFGPYLKLDEFETLKIEEFIYSIFAKLRESDHTAEDGLNGDEFYDHNSFFKMELMIKKLVNSFGGKL